MIETQEHDSGIFQLKMAKPPVNALSPDSLQAIRSGIANLQGTDKAKAIVLSGQPGMFSAGLDVPYLLQLDRSGIESSWKEFLRTIQALAHSSIPVVAAITGHSPAGGAVLSLACDYRVMAEGDFTIGLNEVRVGIPMPGFIFAMARLALGQRNAEIACSTGHLYPPKEALAIGFVDQVAKLDQVVECSIEHCRRLLQLPPDTYARSRRTVRTELHSVLEQLDDGDLASLTDAWFADETQTTLRALVARLGT